MDLPVDAKLELSETAGTKARLPFAATDDFVRHATIRVSVDGMPEVDVDFVVRARDLRQEQKYCTGD